MKKLWSDRFFWWLLIVHVACFILAISLKGIYTLDSFDYLAQAENIAREGSVYAKDIAEPFQPDYYTKRPPLYAVLILAAKTLHSSDYSILLLQAFLSMLNLMGLRYLLRTFDFKVNPDILLIAGIILFSGQMIYTNFVMTEILLQTLLWWAALGYWYFWKSGKSSFLIWSNVLLALALLTKPVVAYFWVPNIILLLWFSWRYKRYWLWSLGLMLPLTGHLISSYNQQITGHYHLSSSGPIFLVDYSTKFLLMKEHGEAYADSVNYYINSNADRMEDYGERLTFMQDEALKVIKAHIGDYLFFHVRGMVTFMIDPGRYDLYHFLDVEEREGYGLFYELNKNGLQGLLNFAQRSSIPMLLFLVLSLLWNVAVLLSVVSFFFNRKPALFLKVLIVLFWGYVCFVTGPGGWARMKVPVYPFLLVTLPFFADTCLAFWQKRKERNKVIDS